MVQNFIWFALHYTNDVVEALDDGFDSFHAKGIQHRKLVNDIEHIDDFLGALAEGVKFTEDIHLGKVELLLTGGFL